jgi:hypothetical protein
MIGKILHPRQDRPLPPKLKSSKQLGQMPASSKRIFQAEQATGRRTSGFTKGFILEDCLTVHRYNHRLASSHADLPAVITS